MVSQTQTMELPSPANYGVLCHRQYADRLREAFDSSGGNNWSSLLASSSTETDQVQAVAPSEEPVEIDPCTKCTVIPTPEQKGQRKERTGYSLLVINGASISPVDLPPMARKQISWAGRLTHQSDFNDAPAEGGNGEIEFNRSNTLQSVLSSVTGEIWKSLTESSYDAENDFLRIDVQPKTFNSEVCNEMKHYTTNLACSASKVSHVVNVVIQSKSSSNDTESPTIQKVYWGISTSKEHFADLNQRLNDNATSELILDSTDPKTGLDFRDVGRHGAVKWNAPVSRAYYKLAQVFEDDHLIDLIASLHSNNNGDTLESSVSSILSHGAGLDIGASPGGWTQVLHNTLCMPDVVAVDPGLLAQRVETLRGVHHVRAEISSDESIKVLVQHAPYSAIVCDASISNANELLVKIAETLDSVSTLLKNSDDTNSKAKDVLAWPLCLVVTLKLPYKTNSSIERNLEKVGNYIPDYLRRIALLGTSSSGDGEAVDVEVKYNICHLFANSISERTLIAVFNKK